MVKNQLDKNISANESGDEYQFLIDNHQLFNQFKAIKLWFEKVEKTKYTPSYFFPKQNSCTYYQQMLKTKRGVNPLITKKSIYDHFKNLHQISEEKGLNFTISDLKSCIEEEIVPTHYIEKEELEKMNEIKKTKINEIREESKKEIKNINKKIIKLEKNNKEIKIDNKIKIEDKNLITFEEIWDEVGDFHSGPQLLDTIEKDLKSSIFNNLSKDVAPFVKDETGDPILDFKKHNHRVLQTDYDTDEINDPEIIRQIAELATIFDKRTELQKNENGALTLLSFQTSADRINGKIRGYNIFNNLRKKGIKISLFKDLANTGFNTIERHTAANKDVPNTTYITTNISIQSVIMIIYGDKKYTPPKNQNYRVTIEEHAKKIVNLIESKILWGRPVK